MSGIITENFGDLSLIDIIYTRPTEESVVLVLVTSGYVDGSAETQNNLLDKMEGYLRHIQSDEFKQEYASNKVFIEVNFSEEPDVLITDLLAKLAYHNSSLLARHFHSYAVRLYNSELAPAPHEQLIRIT